MALSADTLKQVDQFLQDQLQKYDLPAAYAVVAGGEVVLEGAYGGHTPDTPFEIGSITKSVTATAILQLRDRGLLDLDDPVQKHLPWFQLSDEAVSGRITIRHLLTNSSGISTDAQSPVLLQDYDRIYPSLEQGVRALRKVKPVFEPGTKFMYSNMGFTVLGLVVQVVSGRPWATYVQEEIFAPLGMTRSLADLHTGALPIAHPHGWAFGRPWPVGHRILGPFIAPAGSTTVCSARDLARYLSAHMGDIPLPGVTPSSLDEAHCGVHPMDKTSAYAMGWVDTTAKNGDRIIWHNGGTEGSRSIATFAPGHGAGVVILSNRSTQLVDKLGNHVMKRLRGVEPDPVKQGREPDWILSWILVGVALLAAGLLGWLAWSAVTGAPSAYIKRILFALLSAASWYMALKVLPRLGNPPVWKIHLWRLDVILSVGGMLLASTLWTLYTLIR